MFRLLAGGNRYYLGSLGGVGDNRSGVEGPPTLKRQAPTVGQQDVEKATQTEAQEAQRRQQAAQLLEQAGDHLSAVGKRATVLSEDQHALLEKLEKLAQQGGAPSHKELDELKSLITKVTKHLQGEVENVAKKFTIFGHGFLNKKFDDLLAIKKDLQAQLDKPDISPARRQHLTAMLANVDSKLQEKLARVGKVEKYTKTDERMQKLNELVASDPARALQVAADKKTPAAVLSHIAQKYAAEPQRADILKQVLQNKNATGDAVHAIFDKNAGPEFQKLVAAHPSAGAADLAKLAGGDNKDVRALVAKHKNTDAATILKLAEAETDPAICELLTKHPEASQAALEKLLIKDGPTFSAARVAALNCLPDLNGLAPATLEKLIKEAPEDLKKAIDQRTWDTEKTVDKALALPHTAASLEDARDLTSSIRTELGKLHDTLRPKLAPPVDPNVLGIFEQLETRLGNLDKKLKDLQPELNKLERSTDTEERLTHLRGLRDAMTKATARFDTTHTGVEVTDDRPGLKGLTKMRPGHSAKGFAESHNAILDPLAAKHTDIKIQTTDTNVFDDVGVRLRQIAELCSDDYELKGAAVRTFGGVEQIRNELDRSRGQMLQDLEQLYKDYMAKDGSPGGITVLKAQIDALKELNRDNAAEVLTKLQKDNKSLVAAMETHVKSGTLPRAEMMLLATLARNVEKNVAAYKDGMAAATKRDETLKKDVDSAIGKGIDAHVKMAADLCTETGTRLDRVFQEALIHPLTIRPDDIAKLKAKALDLVKVEMKENLTKLLEDYVGAVGAPEKAQQLLGQKDVSPLVVTAIHLQIERLGHVGAAAALAEIDKRMATVKAEMGPEELQTLHGLDEMVGKVVASYEKFLAAADQRVEVLKEKEIPLKNKISFIKELCGDASSGTSMTKTLTVAVAVPVPGLKVTARGQSSFSVQRKGDTGLIEVADTTELGLGVKGKVGTASIGGDVFGGRQTKWTFNTAEEAGKFLHYLETAYPADYKIPNSAQVTYGGIQASVQASLPAAVKVGGQARVQVESESKKNGEEVITINSSMAGSLELPTIIDGAAVSIDCKVTNKIKKAYVNGERKPEKDKVQTELEVAFADKFEVLKMLQQTPGLGDKLKLTQEQVAKLAEKIASLGDSGVPGGGIVKKKALGGSTSVGIVLKVEWDGTNCVGVNVGLQKKSVTEVNVELAFADVAYKGQEVTNYYTTVSIPRTHAGLAKMATFYSVDEELYARTKETSGWTDDQVITDAKGVAKPLGEWEKEWKVTKQEMAEINGLKAKYIAANGKTTASAYQTAIPAKLKTGPMQGKALSEYEALWKKEMGEQRQLNELKALYMADRSFWGSDYQAAKVQRGFHDEGISGWRDGKERSTYLLGKSLHDHERDWSSERKYNQKMRDLRQTQFA